MQCSDVEMCGAMRIEAHRIQCCLGPPCTGSHWANAAPKRHRQYPPRVRSGHLQHPTSTWSFSAVWQRSLGTLAFEFLVATRSLVSISIHSHPSTELGQCKLRTVLSHITHQSIYPVAGIALQPRESPSPLRATQYRSISNSLTPVAHGCSDRMRSDC
jgi:hypothetical protein